MGSWGGRISPTRATSIGLPAVNSIVFEHGSGHQQRGWVLGVDRYSISILPFFRLT